MKEFYEFSAFIDTNGKLKRILFDVKVEGPRPKKEKRFEAAMEYLKKNYDGQNIVSVSEVR